MKQIESIGAYVPRHRITAEEIGDAWDGYRAKGIQEKRVIGYDEDSVTMAVSALKDAISESSLDRDEFATLAVGTTTPPLEEGDIGVTIAEVLGLPADLEVVVFSQSTRAGVRAVLSALRTEKPALAVATDCPHGAADSAIDHAAGAGAVAIATGSTGPTVRETATSIREYPGTRFRQRGSGHVEAYGATAYERDSYTTLINQVVDRLDTVPPALAPTAPNGSLPNRVGRVINEDIYHLADVLGDTGAASPLFGLIAAWNENENSVAVIGYGSGAGADVLVVDGSLSVDWNRDTIEITYAEYLRKRGTVLQDGGEH